MALLREGGLILGGEVEALTLDGLGGIAVELVVCRLCRYGFAGGGCVAKQPEPFCPFGTKKPKKGNSLKAIFRSLKVPISKM